MEHGQDKRGARTPLGRRMRAGLFRAACRYLAREGERLAQGRPSLDARLSLWLMQRLARSPKRGPADAVPDPESLPAPDACAHGDAGHPALTPEGYIGSQRALPDVRYGGRGNTADHGCGWVAAYNARRLLGEAVQPAEVLAEVWRGARRGGRMGTDPFYLMKYFRALGYGVQLATAAAEMERAGRAADAFILCYLFADGDHPGGHFVAGRWEDGKAAYRVFNGAHGGEVLEASLADVMGPDALLRLLLALRKPDGAPQGAGKAERREGSA